MSTLKVNTVVDASGGNTTTVNGVTPNTDSVRGRNLIINGAMQVWQRGTSFTGVSSATYHTDRFQSYNSSNASGESTITKSTDAPDGFATSYKLEVTTADSSLHVNAEYGLYHYFEGQNLQGLKKGTSDAKSLTVSFWVKSSLTGTFVVELMDNDNSNRHINKSYTINTANTWEYKTITFEGDTTGTLDNDNNNSFHINWWLGGGSSFTSGLLQTSWGALSQANRAGGQTNVHATVGNTWQITGIQLEVGSVATEFDYRSYGEELALCQRYFYAKTREGSGSNHLVGMSYWSTTTVNECVLQHPVHMRATPTVSVDTIGDFYGLIPQQAWQQASDLSLNEGGPNTTKVAFTCSSNGSFSTDGRRASVIGIRGDSGRLKVDAEL